MLTGIGIVGLVIVFIAAYVRKCVVVTKVATYSVVFSWGAKPVAVLEPPWSLILWPINQVKATITTEVRPYNLTGCKINCTIDDPTGSPHSRYKHAVGELVTGEISLNYQFYFWKASEVRSAAPSLVLPTGFGEQLQLKSFFNYASAKEDGTINYDTVNERIKDFVQSLLTDKTQGMDIYEAINFPKSKLDEIRKGLQEWLWQQGLPIRIVSLERNAPFKPVDALGKAIDARAALVFDAKARILAAETARQVSVIDANAAKEVAVIGIETARAKGNQEVVYVQALLQAYGLTALPPAERVARLLDLKSLEVYREMAASPSNKMFIVPSEILNGIGKALSTLGGGRR